MSAPSAPIALQTAEERELWKAVEAGGIKDPDEAVRRLRARTMCTELDPSCVNLQRVRGGLIADRLLGEQAGAEGEYACAAWANMYTRHGAKVST